jgi:hypothetical protein
MARYLLKKFKPRIGNDQINMARKQGHKVYEFLCSLKKCELCECPCIKRCTNCKKTYYCSTSCQKANWTKHITQRKHAHESKPFLQNEHHCQLWDVA